MEENSKKGFGYLFTNVIWYHYKWLILVLVFFIAVIVFIVTEIKSNVEYDYNLAVITASEIAMENPEFEATVCEAVGDINGDGEVNVNFQYLLMGDSEWGTGNQERVFLYLSSEDYFLFIGDDSYSRSYSAAEYFDELAPYGITADENNPYRTPLTYGVGEFEPQLYASIIDWTTVGKGSSELLDATMRVIDALK